MSSLRSIQNRHLVIHDDELIDSASCIGALKDTFLVHLDELVSVVRTLDSLPMKAQHGLQDY